MIAKLINGMIRACPESGTDINGKFHTNLPKFYANNLALAAEDDYFRVVYNTKPVGDYISSWVVQNGSIVQLWSPYEPQPEPPEVDLLKLRADVDYMAMMGDYDLDGDDDE